MNHTLSRFIFWFFIINTLIITSCEKPEPKKNVKVLTGTIAEITSVSCIAKGIISELSNSEITEHGHCWSTSPNPTISNNFTHLGVKVSTGDFYSNLTGLNPDTKYYVKAYATNSAGTVYGNEVSFTTEQVTTSPTVTTISVSNITTNSAQSGGNITDNGGSSVTARGVCWSTYPNPTIADDHTIDGSGIGSFVSSVSGLIADSTYFLRAYATNSIGTAYGNEISFTTEQATTSSTVTTISVSNITANSAQSGGNVTDDGGSSITARGVCWSTSPNPTITDDHTDDGSGTGSFVSSVYGLIANSTYYLRAYATNSAGTVYGNEVSFTTEQVTTSPTVTTTSVSNITANSAQSGGDVTDDGGLSVTARGVCWSTSLNPTIADDHTTDGSGAGNFVSLLTGLSQNTTYYVRAYATNSVGTSYGPEVSFITDLVPSVPIVSTNAITNITQYSAQSGGNITSDGGSDIISRGVCWSVNPNPLITDNLTSDGNGIGTYTSSLWGLKRDTKYYVRAYTTSTVTM